MTELRILKNNLPALMEAVKPARVIKQALDDAQHAIEDAMSAASSPSAPGQVPAVVSSELIDSLAVQNVSDTHGELSADGGHAIYLEFGTYKMAPRPFMGPAAVQIAASLPAGVVVAIEQAAD